MSNPTEGQDYRVNMVAYSEDSGTSEIIDLTGAVVTIEYRKPDRTVVTGISPTHVGTTDGKIEYILTDDITTRGTWQIWAKIVDTTGDVSYVNPAVCITFDYKGYC